MMQVFNARFFQTKPNFRGHFYSELINEYSDKTFSTERFTCEYQKVAIRKRSTKKVLKS